MKSKRIINTAMMKLIVCVFAVVGVNALHAEPSKSEPAGVSVEITVELPKLDVDPYHKPYVAVWLETPNRKGVTTIAVWHGKDTWLKDMRQWWRKLGRAGKETLDGISGASRKPGVYTIQWDGKDSAGNAVPNGEYLLNVEASREEGGRSYSRQKIQLGSEQVHVLKADLELGEITIKVNGQ